MKLLRNNILLCIGLLAGSSAWAQEKLSWPEITQQNKPWARWWWEGSAVNEKDLSWILEEYKKVGLGGLEITPIYGVKGYEDKFIDFVSPKWMEMLKYTLDEGKRLGLGIDMAQTSGWPFGGPWVSNEDASKYITYKSYTLKGGERLREPVQYMQKTIVRTVGERIDISELKEPIASNPDLQLHAFDQVRFPKLLPLQVLMAYSDKGKVLDLTTKVDADGKLNWTAPSGNWNLYAAFQGWHGKMVERAGPGGEGYAIDHFSKTATQNFLKHFDQAFKGYDLSYLRAFFNDSYEVDDAQGEANWTPRFFEEFQKRHRYDLRGQLPALFGKDTPEKNERVLCDYRQTISDLLLENYTQTWHQWAKSRGALIRNQAHGSPANILDLYAATDIPEIEGTDLLRIKFASSAANVTGKPLISSESATWENEHFLSRLGDVRKAMDLFLLGGVNHTFYHGANYTPKDEVWPGWLFYAAVHFTPNNPFWGDFHQLNSYVARVQSFMQQGKPNNDLLVYLPISDSFSKPGRTLLQHFDGIDHGFKGSDLEKVAEHLQETGYSFDFISDKQIFNTASSDRKVKTGGILYQTIVVPQTRYIPLATFQKLADLARSGATIIFDRSMPQGVPGLGNFLEQRQADFRNVCSQLKFEDTAVKGLQKASLGEGMVLVAENVDAALQFAKIGSERMVSQGLQLIRRQYDQGYYYFIVNSSGKDIEGWIPLKVAAGSVALFNPMTDQTGYGAIRKKDAGTEVYLQLPAGESLILETSSTETPGPLYPYTSVSGDPFALEGNWNITFVSGGPVLPSPIKTKKLQSWTSFEGKGLKDFSGTARYSISFKKPKAKADKWLMDLGSVEESAVLILNGKNLGTLIGPHYQLEINDADLKRKNQLEIRVSNSMANRIAYLDRNKINWKKFYNINMPARRRENAGPDGLFSAAKWEPKDSGLIGSVSLTPLKILTPQ